METSARSLIANAQIRIDDGIYRIISLPPNAITPAAAVLAEVGEAFSALIVDKDEVTLIIDDEAWEEYHARLIDAIAGEEKWALITPDIALDHDVIGFMALLSAALAKEQIPILCFSAFKRDHLLVPLKHKETAAQTLEKLKSGSVG